MLETWALHYGRARPQLTTWVSHRPITGVRLNKAGSLAIVSSQSVSGKELWKALH